MALENLRIGGIRTVQATRDELAGEMVRDCKVAAMTGALPKVVTYSNGYVITSYHRDPEFRSLIEQADLIDADGMPLVFASRLFCKSPLPERNATTDFVHNAAKAAVQNDLRFYFLGGRPGVAEAAARALRQMHPGLQIVGVRHGFFRDDEIPSICDDVLQSRANVLWVGLGSPHQERFAIAHRERLRGVGWIRTCGGLFDHYTGRRQRAPLWMQMAGMEWLFRLWQEPKRLGARYILTNPVAAYHLMTKTSDRCL